MASALSLIIAVYNKPEFLEKIFMSLANQTFGRFEALVADDGSDNSIAEMIKKYRNLLAVPLKHVRHDHDGFRKTVIVNRAVSEAEADYLVFIDGDSILHHRFLERHYRNRKRGAVLAGRRVMLSENATKLLTLSDISSRRIQSPFFWWNGCLQRQRKHGFYLPFSFCIENIFKKGYWITGANFSMFKDDFASINGYDEAIIGRGGEDINLTARVRLAGMKIKTITREALQYHLFHASDPIPHDKAAFDRMANPPSAWAQRGLSENTG
jgi:glycosyltransferase involved in cell wall biosynthesis